MQAFFWGCDAMKTKPSFLVLFLFLLFVFPRTAFAQGEFLDLSDISSSGSGFLSGDYVSSSPSQDSGLADSLGDSLTDAISSAGGDLAGNVASSAVSGAVGGGLFGDMLGDAAGDWVSDWAGDAIGDLMGDSMGDLVGDILSIPEIKSIQETLGGMASSFKGALVSPNLPYYRVLWMFSGESVINEIDSLFSGDYSNLEEGLNNLKELF